MIWYPHGVWTVEELEREGSSGTGKPVSETTGRRLFVPPTSTKHGILVEEAVSALRMSVRAADLKFAMYWAAQLDMIGLSRMVWHTFVMMTYSDVGIAFPSAPILVFELFQLWCESLDDVQQQERDGALTGPFEPYRSHECPESRRIMLTSVSMLCAFPKSRLVSHADSAQLLHNTGRLELSDWAVKIGASRKLSNVIQPLKDSHTVAVCKAVTCLTQYMVHQHEHGMLRVADLLMEWGHTSLIWDVIGKVCDHFDSMKWAKYYHIKHESMWYWAVGKARPRDHREILFRSSTYSDYDASGDEIHEIPREWKSRHDGKSPAHVFARAIPVQCLLLVVRSNPGILEGITAGDCYQYDETVDAYYDSDGKMNRPFQVPEEAKTMFTEQGRMHDRGFDFYWTESEKLVRQADAIDPYQHTIFNAYIEEETAHGIGMCANDLIISRRISEEDYHEKGYLEENPIVRERTLRKIREEGTDAVPEGDPVSTRGTSKRLAQLENKKKRFRSDRPGPPDSINVSELLEREFPSKQENVSPQLPPPKKKKKNGFSHCEPPGFLSRNGTVPEHVRTKVYKKTSESRELSKVSLWTGTVGVKKRKDLRVVSCGPVSKEESLRAVMCSLIEQTIAPEIFGKHHAFAEDEEIEVTEKIRGREKKRKRTMTYVVARLAPLRTTEEGRDKLSIFRWCEGCRVASPQRGAIDSWIGTQEHDPIKIMNAYPRPSIESDDVLEWCRGCLRMVVAMEREKIDSSRTETVEEARYSSSTLRVLATMKARFEHLIERNVA